VHANTLGWRPEEKLSRETARATDGRNILISAKTSTIIEKKKTTNTNPHTSILFKALNWFLAASGTGLPYQAQTRDRFCENKRRQPCPEAHVAISAQTPSALKGPQQT